MQKFTMYIGCLTGTLSCLCCRLTGTFPHLPCFLLLCLLTFLCFLFLHCSLLRGFFLCPLSYVCWLPLSLPSYTFTLLLSVLFFRYFIFCPFLLPMPGSVFICCQFSCPNDTLSPRPLQHLLMVLHGFQPDQLGPIQLQQDGLQSG